MGNYYLGQFESEPPWLKSGNAEPRLPSVSSDARRSRLWDLTSMTHQRSSELTQVESDLA